MKEKPYKYDIYNKKGGKYMFIFSSPAKIIAFFISTLFIITSTFLPLTGIPSLQLNITDQGDGFYFTDTFSDVNLDNCVLTHGTSKIVLNPQGTESHTYNFSTWNTQSPNAAYTYTALYFMRALPPNYHIKYENKLDSDLYYDAIGTKNNNTYPSSGTAVETRIKQIHHFRFKITQDINSTSELGIYWYGKAFNDVNTTFYYWQPSNIGEFGIWEPADTKKSNGSYIQLQQNFTGELFISNDHYVDICVVTTPAFGKKCALYTNYVEVKATGSGHSTTGSAISPIITPNEIYEWECFSWMDNIKSQTSIRYHILYENNTGGLEKVSNTYLPGNSYGFTSSPVDITTVPAIYNLSILANLTTEDLSLSPEIHNWALTWQPIQDEWKDSFNSSLRIQTEKNTNIKQSNGNVSLLHSLHQWPMFGQNPYNTRTNAGIGPDASHTQIQWYASNTIGDKNKNPIINEAVLYIPTQDGDDIYAYDAQSTLGSSIENPILYSCPLPTLTTDTTPAATSNYIIVPTSASSKGGTIENLIYAFDKTLSDSAQWTFEYSTIDAENPAICYGSSPVINNQNIYLTTWSGDSDIWNTLWEFFNFSQGNNKLLVLDEQGTFLWDYDLPAGSFSSPAVLNNEVYVCCENRNGNSVIALKQTRVEKWVADIGPIGHANPVITNDTLYVVSKRTSLIPFTAYTELYALDISDGTPKWNHSLGDSMPEPYQQAAYATPTIANDMIYATSPDGMLYAFNLATGSQAWNRSIYSRTLTGPYLTASPACVDSIVYIGTPDGVLYALDAFNGTILWEKDIGDSSIVTSPIVVDGLVYFGSENGYIYCCGDFEIPPGEKITGNVVSIPIELPEGDHYQWGYFFANYTTTDGDIRFNILDTNYNILINDIASGSIINSSTLATKDVIRLYADFSMNPNGHAALSEWRITFTVNETESETIFYDSSFNSSGDPPLCTIDVMNNDLGIDNRSAQYQFEFENESGTYFSEWILANCSGVNGSKQRQQITANLSLYNASGNISTYIQIHFRINDSNATTTTSQWHNFSDTPTNPDVAPPKFYNTSFTPNSKWISSLTPICTIDTIDMGTDGNISGLNTSSATFTITFTNASGNHTETYPAQCTGANGTKIKQKITADIKTIPDYQSIQGLSNINFTILDMAGNVNSSYRFTLYLDDVKPTSTISNTAQIPAKSNTSPVEIVADASDDISGVAQVELYYRKSSSSGWSHFEPTRLTTPYKWDFTIGRNDGDIYELCTIATDNAGNVESFPTSGIFEFTYDPNPPYDPTFASEYRFTRNEVPTFTDITFRDDYLLHTVTYRLNFEGTNQWTPIVTLNPYIESVTPQWNLTQNQWDLMQEDVPYYISFKLVDSLGNVYETPSGTKRLLIIKDLSNDTIYDPDLSDFDSLNWNNKYTITIPINDSDISQIQLWYQYSKDNSSWSNWSQYGSNITDAPYKWTFTVPDGSGYYRFQSRVFDLQDQVTVSAEKSVYITVFPLLELIVFLVLLILLIIISVLIFRKRKHYIG